MTKVPEILLIYTGGTIGMIKDYSSNALKAFNFNHLYEKIPELNQLQCNIESISFETPIDSSNMNPVFWSKITAIIESHYDSKDGFVVLSGSDTMAYINLAGNPYCNSARYCEYLCEQSLLMDYSQSTSRAYRICAHFLIAGAIGILALYLKGTGISLYAVAFVIAMAIFISTFFISIHADAAEAIQIIFLEDEEFTKRGIEDVDKKFNRNDLTVAFNVEKRTELAD